MHDPAVLRLTARASKHSKLASPLPLPWENSPVTETSVATCFTHSPQHNPIPALIHGSLYMHHILMGSSWLLLSLETVATISSCFVIHTEWLLAFVLFHFFKALYCIMPTDQEKKESKPPFYAVKFFICLSIPHLSLMMHKVLSFPFLVLYPSLSFILCDVRRLLCYELFKDIVTLYIYMR